MTMPTRCPLASTTGTPQDVLREQGGEVLDRRLRTDRDHVGEHDVSTLGSSRSRLCPARSSLASFAGRGAEAAAPARPHSVVIVLVVVFAGAADEPLHGRRQELQQVAGDHALGAARVLRSKVGRQPMDEATQAGRIGGRQALGD